MAPAQAAGLCCGSVLRCPPPPPSRRLGAAQAAGPGGGGFLRAAAAAASGRAAGAARRPAAARAPQRRWARDIDWDDDRPPPRPRGDRGDGRGTRDRDRSDADDGDRRRRRAEHDDWDSRGGRRNGDGDSQSDRVAEARRGRRERDEPESAGRGGRGRDGDCCSDWDDEPPRHRSRERDPDDDYDEPRRRSGSRDRGGHDSEPQRRRAREREDDAPSRGGRESDGGDAGREGRSGREWDGDPPRRRERERDDREDDPPRRRDREREDDPPQRRESERRGEGAGRAEGRRGQGPAEDDGDRGGGGRDDSGRPPPSQQRAADRGQPEQRAAGQDGAGGPREGAGQAAPQGRGGGVWVSRGEVVSQNPGQPPQQKPPWKQLRTLRDVPPPWDRIARRLPPDVLDEPLNLPPPPCNRPSGGAHHRKELQAVRYVLENCEEDDVESTLRCVEKFTETCHWLKVAAEEKGKVLDQAIERFKPKTVLELGTYCCAYSALRMARSMDDDTRLVSIEIDPIDACLARNVVEISGRSHQVDVWIGRGADVLPHVLRRFGPRSIDLVFLDHRGTKYHVDVTAMMRLGLLRPGSVVIADNILCPGAPEFVWMMQKSPEFVTQMICLKETGTDIDDMMSVSQYWPVRQPRRLTEEEEDDEDVPRPEPLYPEAPRSLWRLARDADSISWRSQERLVARDDWAQHSHKLWKAFEELELTGSAERFVTAGGPLHSPQPPQKSKTADRPPL
eukprot:TRINITY_DN34117_c0_g1_i1.p1 TRINITY_DN34117_c0_g1~~TRINITY_DN34117_c0_g1_i1.p1  ORF type:complete len:774 (+),score=206.90 TRINITY_DN34117_c0_g1_i1:122-2323(+)